MALIVKLWWQELLILRLQLFPPPSAAPGASQLCKSSFAASRKEKNFIELSHQQHLVNEIFLINQLVLKIFIQLINLLPPKI